MALAAEGETTSWKSCAGITVKDPLVLAAPPAVVSSIGPVTALFGTTVITCVAAAEVTLAGTRMPFGPANVTAVMPVSATRFMPVRVTGVPTAPLFGLKSVILGARGGTERFVPVTVMLRNAERRLKYDTSIALCEANVTCCVRFGACRFKSIEEK